MSDLENGAGAFVQPSLDNPTGETAIVRDPVTGEHVLTESALVVRDAPVENINSGKTDELSVALAESRKPKPATVFEEPKPVGKYALDYSLKGEAIHETHATVRSALARVAALGRLGIVPATSTNV